MARPKTPNGERWLWYSLRTPNCVPLDPGPYASTVYDGEVIPWPDWCCKAPDGGVHIDARRAAVDVHLSQAPRGPDEVTWTCDFQVLLVARGWLALIEDLIDGQLIALGEVLVDDQVLGGWATINEAHAPRLLSSEGWSKVCPICGSPYATLHGEVFFADPAVHGRLLIVGPVAFLYEKMKLAGGT